MQKTPLIQSTRCFSAESVSLPSSAKPKYDIRSVSAALTLALLLAACGGGGGGGSSSAPAPAPTPAPAPPPPPSLIPPAPTPAEVLSTEAIQLRPLQVDASWNYQGESVQVRADGSSFGPIVAYQNTVKHLLRSGGGVVEQSSNAGNEGSSSSKELLLSGQEIRSIEQVDLAGTGKLQSIQWPELRSPVRAGDQYTLLDSTLIELTQDLDGDGKNDAVEVAGYARVIGPEVLQSQRLGTINSVRVDSFIRARAKLTLSKIEAPVVEARAKVWYAQGLGIVRQTIEEVPDTNGLRRVYTEQLRSFQAGDRGLGFTDLVPLRLPADFPSTPGQALSSTSNFVIQAGGGAFLFNANYNYSYDKALLVHLSPQGSMDAALLSSELQQAGGSLLGHAEGLLSIRESGFDPIQLRNFDLQGRAVDSTPPQAIDRRLGDPTAVEGFKLEKAIEGRQLWLVWTLVSRTADSKPGDFRYESRLWLRGFDRVTGQPLGDAVQLYIEPGINYQGFFARLAVFEGRPYVVWQKPSSGDVVSDLQVSVLNPALGPSGLITRTLVSNYSDPNLKFTAMRGGPLFIGAIYKPTGKPGKFLFQLDSQGAPILASGETVLQAGPPLYLAADDYQLRLAGTEHLMLSRASTINLTPSESQIGSTEVLIYSLDGRPLSALQPQVFRTDVFCSSNDWPILDAGNKLSFMCEDIARQINLRSLWLR
ncbi:hypothetical protein [Paucibacter sp. KBW04]|uniref:hypothetical protein n=1 Tax=Paucibacter sp. KBW04 TaxID=2153361 RepID=UPI0012DC2B92|nr:hypothetical protein [Paucibacter sp. KBW04]